MALQTETYDLEAEVQRLEDKISELDDILSGMTADHDARGGLVETKQQLSMQANGVRWAAREAADADYLPDGLWDEDVDEITLAGLTFGERSKVTDNIPADAGREARRGEFVAAGSVHPRDESIVDDEVVEVPAPAPYVDPKPSEQTGEERLGVVGRLPAPYVEWAFARVDELTTVGGNGRLNFEALRAEIEATSPGGSSEIS
jgi:hypothetical protein